MVQSCVRFILMTKEGPTWQSHKCRGRLISNPAVLCIAGVAMEKEVDQQQSRTGLYAPTGPSAYTGDMLGQFLFVRMGLPDGVCPSCCPTDNRASLKCRCCWPRLYKSCTPHPGRETWQSPASHPYIVHYSSSPPLHPTGCRDLFITRPAGSAAGGPCRRLALVKHQRLLCEDYLGSAGYDGLLARRHSSTMKQAAWQPSSAKPRSIVLIRRAAPPGYSKVS